MPSNESASGDEIEIATEARSPRVVAVCGSRRPESRTRVVLEAVLAASRRAGATTDLLDLRAYELPALNPSGAAAEDAGAFECRLARADSVVLGTPNYHGSYAGSLKNALDYCPRDAFEGTTVGLLEVAGGRYPGSAAEHLRTVVRTLHAWPLPRAVVVPSANSTVSTEETRDEEVAERARRMGRELVQYAGGSSAPPVDARATEAGGLNR